MTRETSGDWESPASRGRTAEDSYMEDSSAYKGDSSTFKGDHTFSTNDQPFIKATSTIHKEDIFCNKRDSTFGVKDPHFGVKEPNLGAMDPTPPGGFLKSVAVNSGSRGRAGLLVGSENPLAGADRESTL